MPCYDDRNNEPRVEYVNGVNPQPLNDKILKLKNDNRKMEAGLCAILTELEKRGIANEVISQASKSGLIDLMTFWEKHSKEDEARLAKKFHEFSEHEQAQLKKLINSGKI